MAKIFFLSSSDGLVQVGLVTLFRDNFYSRHQHFELSSAPPAFTFSQLQSLTQGAWNQSYAFICDAIFFTCTHAQSTKHAMECTHYSRSLSVCMERIELALSIHIDSVLEQTPGSVILQSLLRKPVRTDFCSSVLDGKLQLKHKHKQDWKTLKCYKMYA